MKKAISLFTVAILFACSNDDYARYGGLALIGTHSENPTIKGEKGKYENLFSAVYTYDGKHDISGYVKFTIKNHGTISSERGIVPHAKGTQGSYFINLDTDIPIDKSYLLSVDFVKD